MRYTTIIDISEYKSIYANNNCKMVYLHLVLKSGYHDHDRDMIHISIRRLAADLGITIAACRHALAMLQQAKLLTRQGPMWIVKKWNIEQQITPRAKTKKQQREAEIIASRQAREDERKIRELADKKAYLASIGKTLFMDWYERCKDAADKGNETAAKSVIEYAERYRQESKYMAKKMAETSVSEGQKAKQRIMDRYTTAAASAAAQIPQNKT